MGRSSIDSAFVVSSSKQNVLIKNNKFKFHRKLFIQSLFSLLILYVGIGIHVQKELKIIIGAFCRQFELQMSQFSILQ